LAPPTSGRLVVEGGYFSSSRAGRIGRGANAPPQFGQTRLSGPLAHCAQNVHSNEQITRRQHPAQVLAAAFTMATYSSMAYPRCIQVSRWQPSFSRSATRLFPAHRR
jgi:hypothetical protein